MNATSPMNPVNPTSPMNPMDPGSGPGGNPGKNPGTNPGPRPETALSLGRRAAEDLAGALELTGCRLPSLTGGFPVMGRAHVELGGASAEVVFALARWIREQA